MSSDQLYLRNICSGCAKPNEHKFNGKAPLGQTIPEEAWVMSPDYAQHHRSNQRLWSHVVIPELGVLVVAIVAGRCAIYSLLKAEEKDASQSTHCFMQLDWIVPFDAQEKGGDRPLACLRGIAVAPVDPRKRYNQWRLFLHYDDNTVICYLLRRDEALGMAVGV
jgi:hypothetical protein